MPHPQLQLIPLHAVNQQIDGVTVPKSMHCHIGQGDPVACGPLYRLGQPVPGGLGRDGFAAVFLAAKNGVTLVGTMRDKVTF